MLCFSCMVSKQLNKPGGITVSLIRKRLVLLISSLFLTLATFSMSASASNEALFDLLKVLVDKGTITADEYSILKGPRPRTTRRLLWWRQRKWLA